jgi:nicotinamidase-related amidase
MSPPNGMDSPPLSFLPETKSPLTKDIPTHKILTLQDAVSEPRQHRDMKLAAQPMPNYSCTPGGPNGGLPYSFWASWTLHSRPRRIALLLDDCQEEYRPYAADIIPNLVDLVKVFREHQVQAPVETTTTAAETETTKKCPLIVWSSWSRTFDDGISNCMDRWYGPHGLDPDDPENAVYIFQGAPGMAVLEEIAPTEPEILAKSHYQGKHLDMFWTFCERDNGEQYSYLDEKLCAAGVDTVVIAGLWTDECIIATAYGALSRGYDVVVVSDAVGTATPNGDAALTIIKGTCGHVVTTREVVEYMTNDFVLGEVGAVKGTKHPDGRKD